MTRLKTHKLAPLAAALSALALSAVLGACGGGDSDTASGPDAGTGGGDDSGSLLGDRPSVTKLEIDPPSATITSVNGAPATQPFQLIATYSDGSRGPLTADVGWLASAPQVGAMDGAGVYKASGAIGGTVRVQATHRSGAKATAQLTVKLVLQENPGSVPGATQAALKAATTPDAAVTWAYPYDGTVFPRGLSGPLLMWNGGAATDAYYVHLSGKTFELESFATAAPPSRYAFSAGTWQRFVDSEDGAVDVTVARFSGGAAKVIAKHKWTIAPASMRGTIYYWANNTGRVMRIKPGASAPDDFSAGVLNPATGAGCTMTCHTVSADGSTLVAGGDVLGGTYDLLKNRWVYDTVAGVAPATPTQPAFSEATRPTKRIWSMPALTPDGKHLVQNGSALPGPPGKQDGLYETATGKKLAGTGLEGVHLGMPAFSPDGTRLAFVGVEAPGLNALRMLDFDPKTLKVSNARDLVQQGTGDIIAFPTVAPDSRWIVYHRGPLDTRNGTGDLFIASGTTANAEVRLEALNGDKYPFAAGDRDRHWNYEPAFAPVAAGGYFWVVFTSRRTYGNKLTGAKEAVKQLWVAAIEQNPQPGKDPSHPAFFFPGQREDTLNMRGFWALDPCKGDGQGCGSGTECCGGYCAPGGGDGGGLVCKSQKTECALNGDRCDATSDCCNASQGVTCINHVCSEPTPR